MGDSHYALAYALGLFDDDSKGLNEWEMTTDLVGARQKRLLDYLKACYKEHRIRADGNCQFRALAFLLGNESTHESIRQKLCNVLQAGVGLARPADAEGDNWFEVGDGSYGPIDLCRKDGQWGNYQTLQAAAHLYDVRIVYVDDGGTPVALEPRDTSESGKVWFLRWHNHYHYSVFVSRNYKNYKE